jgi:hypothetical protein
MKHYAIFHFYVQNMSSGESLIYSDWAKVRYEQ